MELGWFCSVFLCKCAEKIRNGKPTLLSSICPNLVHNDFCKLMGLRGIYILHKEVNWNLNFRNVLKCDAILLYLGCEIKYLFLDNVLVNSQFHTYLLRQ